MLEKADRGSKFGANIHCQRSNDGGRSGLGQTAIAPYQAVSAACGGKVVKVPYPKSPSM